MCSGDVGTYAAANQASRWVRAVGFIGLCDSIAPQSILCGYLRTGWAVFIRVDGTLQGASQTWIRTKRSFVALYRISQVLCLLYRLGNQCIDPRWIGTFRGLL